MVEIHTRTPQQTQEVGELLARYLQRGDRVGFTGDLGAGKTCLIQGLCRGLAVEDEVTSPTFVLMNCYKGHIPVYHFDLYRLDEPLQLYDLDYEMYFWGDGITLVEWVERAWQLIAPDDFINLVISFGKEESDRIIRIQGLSNSEEFARELAAICLY